MIAPCGTMRITTPTGPASKEEIQSPHPHRTQTPQVPVSSSNSSFLLPGHKMMYSICLDDGSDTDADWEQLDQDFPGLHTPPATSSTEGEDTRKAYESDESDDEHGEPTQAAPKRKKGGYDSRIEQILYENPELPILIVDAGKSIESGGKYIVYTIRTGVCFISFRSVCGLTYG